MPTETRILRICYMQCPTLRTDIVITKLRFTSCAKSSQPISPLRCIHIIALRSANSSPSERWVIA